MIEVLGWATVIYGAACVSWLAWMLFIYRDGTDVSFDAEAWTMCGNQEHSDRRDDPDLHKSQNENRHRSSGLHAGQSVNIQGRNVLSLPEMKILDIRRKALADQSMFNDRTEARIHHVASIMHRDIRCEQTCDAIDDFLTDPFLDPGQALDRLRASFSEIEA